MKIIDMELNSSVLRGEKQDAYSCLREGIVVLKAANVLVESLRDWDSTSNVNKAAYSDMQLVNCENLFDSILTPGIDTYKMASLSKTPVLYERLAIFQYIRDQLYPILEQIVLAYVDLSEDEKTAVKELSLKILEQLSFFVFYEFNFDSTAISIQEKREVEVNDIVQEYVGRESICLEEIVLFMMELYQKYRPTIPSFDFSEEEQDLFYFQTGIYAHSLLENIDALDPDVVRMIIYEEISPEEVLRKLLPQKEVRPIDLF